jgi:transcription termination factor NusB
MSQIMRLIILAVLSPFPIVCVKPGTAPPSSRHVAHSVLLRCAKGGAFADRTLRAALQRESLGPKDGGHATELVYGVLRWQRSLDFTLGQLAQLNRTDESTRIALRIGAYELLHMRTADHAAVDEAVGLAGHAARRRFVNGVLRNVARRRDELQTPDTLSVAYVWLESNPQARPQSASARGCLIDSMLSGQVLTSRVAAGRSLLDTTDRRRACGMGPRQPEAARAGRPSKHTACGEQQSADAFACLGPH